MWDKLFAPADLLQKGMSASWLRNSVIRNNIANVETPGFKASDVQFESLLYEALSEENGISAKMTRDRHINFGRTDLDSITARTVTNRNLSMRMDENNVDIEAENAKLAQNSIQYNTLLYKLNSELSRLKLAITEGK